LARLSLDDLDWRKGWLRLAAPKGRRERHLPLPEEVGQALAAYLRSAPPESAARAVFRTRRGQRPMRSGWLSERVGAAMARAGLGAAGKRAHLLRRTFATHLVQQGVSLKAVADLLGHASLSTTQVYAKVNLPMLRAVAQPWPGEAQP
jgi:integrase/recombinase XerD